MNRQEEIDIRYLRICREYAQLTRCKSRKVGALIANPDQSIIALGLNGPPRGVKHCGEICPRHEPGADSSLAICPAVHAEVNAILTCGRTNNSTVGCSMYIYPLGPCKDCAATIINAGISRLIFPESEPYDELGPWMLNQTDIDIVTYPIEMLEDFSF